MRGARRDEHLRLTFAQAALPNGARVVVALSGGSDSVALASLAAESAADLGTQVTLVHVNHGIRISGALDEAVAVSVAAHLSLPIRIRRLHNVTSDEAALRAARYHALVDAARDGHATHVLTGHTAQDQSETVLLALFRGTGPRGLRGIAPSRELAPGIALVRPLLRADREALQRHCERAHLPYVVDPTNDDLRYRRNALRSLLVAMREEMPGLDRAVARCAAILRKELADGCD